MTVKASAISRVTDLAESITLRAPGLSYTETHHSPGLRVPRKGGPYWETRGDYDFVLRVTYTTTGSGPHGVEIWASNGPGVADAMLVGVGLPAAGSGETLARVCATALGVIPADQSLYLSAKVVVGDGTVDAGVVLERGS